MILHPCFVARHAKAAQKGFYIQGRRTFLSPKKSAFFLKSAKYPTFFDSCRPEMVFGYLTGLPAGFIKKISLLNEGWVEIAHFGTNAVLVNGFNNDFIGWGPEDIEFFQRLANNLIFIKKK